MATKPALQVGRKSSKPTAPEGSSRRLSAATEAQIRAMYEQPGFNSPTIRVLLIELDAVRAERDAALARLGE